LKYIFGYITMYCQLSSNFRQTESRKFMAEPNGRAPRSTDASDYQDLMQPIGAMAKYFDDGFSIPLHHHDRDQLLYAVSGVMRLRTTQDAWVIPSDRAVYIPAGVEHSVTMHGNVDMRTLYIAASPASDEGMLVRVVVVSNLLRELILALSREPVQYGADSRGAHIAKMIHFELNGARQLAFSIPLPRDRRLQRLCAALLANPADRRTLENWSEVAGASPRTLARLFESNVGMNFNRWRQRIRLHNALEALSRGDPISRVARQNGYHSTSAFSAAFKAAMGMPPSQVRSSSLKRAE
jgi:AraC-like DNA-binding protein/mannose-6-phosphate isomerase-like protein (cupin superfamily)